MDRLSETLPEIRQFILPQGHRSAAGAHIARTVCRRVERNVLSLCTQEKQKSSVTQSMEHILVFLNRLSDYFFVLARYLNHRHQVKEKLWAHP
jgi:cob(I)alamin adenosyltransferase